MNDRETHLREKIAWLHERIEEEIAGRGSIVMISDHYYQIHKAEQELREMGHQP